MKNADMFSDLTKTLAGRLFSETEYPWEVLPKVKAFILEFGPTLDPNEYDHPAEDVWIAKTATIYPTSYIAGPTIIGPGTEVRPSAFIRGSALVGRDCVVGNSTELKNCILFDKAQAPHYNYIGDSVLGYYAHVGAGSICSNLKTDKKNIVVHNGTEAIETGLRKFGAILGDYADIGCNSVLCPGAVIEPHASAYPLSRVRGVVPRNCIFKDPDHIVERQ